jgi:hypothetical protein
MKWSLSADEWIKKMWHVYTIEVYSSTKKNKVMSFVVKCIHHRDCHVKQNKPDSKDKYCILYVICGIQIFSRDMKVEGDLLQKSKGTIRRGSVDRNV